MKKIAVFASGNGTNFENILNRKDINAEIVLLICDNKNARAIEIARKNAIDTFVFSPKDYDSKKDYEREISKHIDTLDIDFLVLSGYMRILSKNFVEKYDRKIINIHPSMLPLYKGKNAIEQAFLDGKDIFGVTVHYVNAEVDDGEIILQERVSDTFGLSLEEVTRKVHDLEYKLYPMAIIKLI